MEFIRICELVNVESKVAEQSEEWYTTDSSKHRGGEGKRHSLNAHEDPVICMTGERTSDSGKGSVVE